MIRLLLIVICLLPGAVVAQNPTDVFTIARSGTAAQAQEVLATNPKAFEVTDDKGISPLILAAYRGNTEVVQLLIENGADINRTSPMGTALMAAIVKGQNDIAWALVQHGADTNLTDNNGTTALMYAAQFRNAEVVKLLLDAKTDKSKTDKKGKTAFEYAVFSGNDEIINLLK